jgi:hypothetical protein
MTSTVSLTQVRAKQTRTNWETTRAFTISRRAKNTFAQKLALTSTHRILDNCWVRFENCGVILTVISGRSLLQRLGKVAMYREQVATIRSKVKILRKIRLLSSS